MAVQRNPGFAMNIFVERGVHERVVFIGSGKLGFPEEALFAFALGCDMVNVAREALLAIGCIQAQRCHTNHCPTGIATQKEELRKRFAGDAAIGFIDKPYTQDDLKRAIERVRPT